MISRQHWESARETLPMSTVGHPRTLVPRAWWQTRVITQRLKYRAFGTVTEGFTALQTTFSQPLVETNPGSTTG